LCTAAHAQREGEERLLVRAHLQQRPRGRRERHVAHLRFLRLERRGVGPLRVPFVEQLAQAPHRVHDFERPVAQRHVAPVAPEREPGLRPSRATIAWLPSSSGCSDAWIGGLALSTQNAANASRNRSFIWLTPTGSKALTSSRAHLDVLHAALRSALVGRSPDIVTRLGRMKL